jgi:hypothetical protein
LLKLKDIPLLNVRSLLFHPLSVVILGSQEYTTALLRAENGISVRPGLHTLKQFCSTGNLPPATNSKEYSLFVKELLKYRMLDVAALVHGLGLPALKVGRSELPDLLTRRVVSVILFSSISIRTLVHVFSPQGLQTGLASYVTPKAW